MKGQKKSNNGITLIALVITIIILLILAGVSISAIIGEDGILTKSQYATFLNEMAAVEEAVQMWKAGEIVDNDGKETNTIPTNGMCKVNDLTNTERLAGEVGYYRVWSMSDTEPTTSIFSSADSFNGIFEPELMYYPAGVQDLYYLNNDAIGIKGDKTYVIDAATGIVYSMTGIGLKGVRCYSSSMAKSVMSGEAFAPIFAESEVSGTGAGDKLAGNTGSEFLEDGNKNPEYEQYGFEIIANSSSNNIFKLYNNGDLYGKGLKGTQLNTSPEEMEKINSYVWKEWKVPEKVGEYKKIIIGMWSSMYFIDKNDDLWVYGANSASNKYGLTEAQSVEYTGREPMKVELNGKKVSRVFAGTDTTFIITTDNKLLVAGLNTSGQLGLGDTHSTVTFEEVPVSNVENIETIYCTDTHKYANIIKYNDNTFYFAGTNGFGGLGTGKSGENYKTFTQIWNGVIGPDIDQDIKDVFLECQNVILKKDGTVWVAGYAGYLMGNLPSGSNLEFRKHNIENVKNIYKTHSNRILMEAEDGLYCMASNTNNFGTDYYGSTSPVKMELPSDLQSEGIKECYSSDQVTYILSNTGKLYGTGKKSFLGLNESSGYTQKIQKLNIENIETMYDEKIEASNNESVSLVLLLKDGKYYTTGTSTLMFSNDIVQKNWTVVAKNVKFFNATGNGYIDRDNNLWVAGDSRLLGLGTESQEYKNISNYIKCTDSNIQGKAKEVIFTSGVTYVLTTDNQLWATGLYENIGTLYYPGWNDTENKTTFVKLLDNVSYFTAASNNIRIAILQDGMAYGWGLSYTGANGISGNTNYQVPTEYTLPAEIGGVANIFMLKSKPSLRSCIVTKTGKIFQTGTWTNGSYDGGYSTKQVFSEYTHNITLASDEVMKDISSINDANSIFLTSKGRLFGYGNAKYLGIGSTLNDLTQTRELTGINDVEQIVAGNGWYVAVKKDGTVWGTGSNTYGILGRWIGIDRKQPNSRYKTAFEWVECTELEI